MKSYSFIPKKNSAQAMVEFAIVLPVLLLLLYGILEAGRLLFMYSSIVTASRQAVRYGAATGMGRDYAPGGPDNSAVPRYQDCYGIRWTANRADFLNAFDFEDVIIQNDNGPGSTPNPHCDASPLPDSDTDWTPSGSEDRLIVTVTGHFIPLVPKIVPFMERDISATSARTVLFSVPIEMPDAGGGAGGGSLTLEMTPTPTTFMFEGEVITIDYRATNNGTIELSGLTVTDSEGKVAIICSDPTLAPASDPENFSVCTGTYTITAADVAAGSVTFKAIAQASDGTNLLSSIEMTAIVPLAIQPRIALEKTASVASATENDTITYTFVLTNTGNVAVTGATVSDPKLGGLVAGCSGDLAVGAAVSCTKTYVVTVDDVDAGTIVNTATASAQYAGPPVQTVTADATETVYTPALVLIITANPMVVDHVGQVVTYSYTLYNNTDTRTLYMPYSIAGVDCTTATSPLNPRSNTVCTRTLTVTQAQFDTASIPGNPSVTANVCNEVAKCNKPIQSNSYPEPSIAISGQHPALALQMSAAPNPATTVQNVTYTYRLTNTGNVTLSQPFTLNDTRFGNLTSQCSTAAISPGTFKDCTYTYQVSNDDILAGSIVSSANATATFGSQTVPASAGPYTLTTFQGPRLALQVIGIPATYTSTDTSIYFVYRLTNTGTVPLNAPYVVTASKATGPVDCSTATSPLPVGQTTYCDNIYVIPPEEQPVGSKIVNSSSITYWHATGQAAATAAPVTVSNPVPACNTTNIYGAAFAKNTPLNTMTVTFTNKTGVALRIKDITVRWNHDRGHGNGGDRTLQMQNAMLGAVTLWDRGSGARDLGPTKLITPTNVTLPTGDSIFQFTFQQSYDTWENDGEPNESVVLTFDMAGCEGVTITYTRP